MMEALVTKYFVLSLRLALFTNPAHAALPIEKTAMLVKLPSFFGKMKWLMYRIDLNSRV